MSNAQDRRSLLRPEKSDLSDASIMDGDVAPTSTTQQRHGYRRKPTNEGIELLPSLHDVEHEENLLSFSNQPERPTQGLGISGAIRPVSIARKPVGTKTSPQAHRPTISFDSTNSASSPNAKASPRTPGSATPGSGKPLLSPPWHRHEPRDQTPDESRGGESSPLRDSTNGSGQTGPTLLPNVFVDSNNADDDRTRLKESVMQNMDNGPSPSGCISKRDIHTSRGSWISMTLLGLSVYSTVMSVLWVVTSFVQPRWGRSVYSGGTLTPSTASLLSALFAKTIELSFVTVFVGFLGQVLSRRSIDKSPRGVSIAEMTMRTWVIQPGFMITHWQTIRYAGWTFLGLVSFVAALGAMLYTTASDALISPKLKFGDWTDMSMQGLVRTSYANPAFITASCQTPVTTDSSNGGSTCLAIEQAGQTFYNYMNWLETWAEINVNGSGESPNILDRPPGIAMLFDNTTVQGSWIMPSTSNMTAINERFNRIVVNITMAMPHAGVFTAARDPKNEIMQPDELDGVGGYSIRAAVVSPAVNVICADVTANELAPLVYTNWTYAMTNTNNVTGQKVPYGQWQTAIPTAGSAQKYLNATVLDEIFQWGEKYSRRPGVFPMFPLDYNTVINAPNMQIDSLYILTKSALTTNYTVCSLRSFLYPNCSTEHDVSGTAGGSSLTTNCEDPTDKQSYALSVPDHPITISTDWANYIFSWALSISLNDGSLNANSSTARLLSDLITLNPGLSPLQPSIAEALVAMAGPTLLTSTSFAAFTHYWQYAGTTLTPGMYQPFNASVSTQQYTSGYAQAWQAVFYPVLLVVAFINVFCLAYFFIHSGLLTDFTEPQNLFAIAVNSPPSTALTGSCGAGPERDQFCVEWLVRMEEDTGHYFLREGEGWERKLRRRRAGGGAERREGMRERWGASAMSHRVEGSLRGSRQSHNRLSSYSKLSNARSLL